MAIRLRPRDVAALILLASLSLLELGVSSAFGPWPMSGDVHPGFPFVERDDNGFNICIGTEGGQMAPPFTFSENYVGHEPRVYPLVPFVERDPRGTNVCVGSGGGYMFPPFVRKATN